MDDAADKPRKEVQLQADQFSVNEQGEIVIKNDELLEAIKSQLDQDDTPESGSISIGIGIQ